MFSYWEQKSFLEYDVLVIGSGITGLSTAISLKERKPQERIAVLERNISPEGASTRNAGFACIGSFTELWDDLQHLPEEKILQLIQMRRDGLLLLRKRLGDQAIGYTENGSYELIGKNEQPLIDRLSEVNTLLYPILKGDAFTLCNEKMHDFGFNKKEVRALIQNHFEGELHPGKMMQQLILNAMRAGIILCNGCGVDSIEEKADGLQVKVSGTGENDPVVFHAEKIAVCTNAFTKKLLPDLDIVPGRGQVLITEPIPGLPFKGIFHFDRGYYYFRGFEGRVLLGGGRSLDFEKETTTEMALNDRIQQHLEEKLRTVILPGRNLRIAQRWSGIMAFGREKFPILEKYSDRIYLGVRMGGMGIAIGSEVAERLAKMIVESK